MKGRLQRTLLPRKIFPGCPTWAWWRSDIAAALQRFIYGTSHGRTHHVARHWMPRNFSAPRKNAHQAWFQPPVLRRIAADVRLHDVADGVPLAALGVSRVYVAVGLLHCTRSPAS